MKTNKKNYKIISFTKIETTPNQNNQNDHFNAFSNMLYDYICELHEFDYENIPLKTQTQLEKEYFNEKDTTYKLLIDHNIYIGFAIIGYKTNCHKAVDIYIEEFYIKPQYRKQGYGKILINDILFNTSQNINTVCLYILPKNKNAISFWKKVFSKWENITNTIRDTNALTYVDWYVYSRNKQKKE